MTVVNLPAGVTNRNRGLSQSQSSFFDFYSLLYKTQNFARNIALPPDIMNILTMKDVISEDSYILSFAKKATGKISTGKKYIVNEPLTTFGATQNREMRMQGRQVNVSIDYVDQDFYPAPNYISKVAMMLNIEAFTQLKQIMINEFIHSIQTKSQKLTEWSTNGQAGNEVDAFFNASVQNATNDLDLSGIDFTTAPDAVYEIVVDFVNKVRQIRIRQGAGFAIKPVVFILDLLGSVIYEKLRKSQAFIQVRDEFEQVNIKNITGQYQTTYPSFDYMGVRFVSVPEYIMEIPSVSISFDNSDATVTGDAFYGNDVDSNPNYKKAFSTGKCVVVFPDRCCASSASMGLMFGRDVGFGSIFSPTSDTADFVANDNRNTYGRYVRDGETPLDMIRGVSLVNMATARGTVFTDFGIRSSNSYSRVGNENINSPIDMEVLVRSPNHYIADTQQFKYRFFTMSNLTDFDGARNIKVNPAFFSTVVARNYEDRVGKKQHCINNGK